MTDAKDTYDDIVEEFTIENTRILISNSAYKNRNPEEVEKILQRVASIGWEIMVHNVFDNQEESNN